MKIIVIAIALLAFVSPAVCFQDNPEALLAQGKAAMRRGDASRAAELFEKAVALRSNNAEAHYWLARAYGAIAQTGNAFQQMSMGGKMKAEADRLKAKSPAAAAILSGGTSVGTQTTSSLTA